MTKKRRTRILGICTSFDDVEDLNYEKRALFDAGEDLYDEVLLIDSREVVYEFLRGTEKPSIRYNGRDIADLASLQVRSTKGREASIALLVRALDLCGCDIFDPLDRFTVGYASKLLSTVTRFKNGVGSDTFIAFDREQSVELVNSILQRGILPLILKPITGRRGSGIQVLVDEREIRMAVNAFFAARSDKDFPLFLQRYVNFIAEYRVMLVDETVLGIVQKHNSPGSVVANVARGATLTQVDEPAIAVFVQANVDESGVLGVDVALDDTGQYHIIETNRAPEWAAFQNATGVDVARRIIERSIERLDMGETSDIDRDSE